MRFTNKKAFFSAEAEYIEYRNIIKLTLVILKFLKICFILRNKEEVNQFNFFVNYFNIIKINTKYNQENNKLYIIIKFIFIKIVLDLLKEESNLQNNNNQNKEYYNYINNIQNNKSKIYYKDYYKYNLKPKDIKLIAYYLTQFHTIPENDKWWGKGFTEWTNVTRALPQFYGHYQPRLPGDLGFYDLRIKEVHQKQVEIAKNYGIYGFCYYFYWFKGKRLLEKPLDLVINNPDLDFPFCLFWANESWARRWDGSEQDILIAQEYSDEDDLNLIKFLLPIFKDKRYIRINNKPLINIYRPALMPNIKKTISTWKKYCKENGIDDLYITISNTHNLLNPKDFGADAAIEYAIGFPNNYDINKLKLFNNEYTSGAWIHNYEDVIEYSLTKEKNDYKEFRSLSPDWDNEARRSGGKGGTIVNSTPSLYKFWLEKLIKDTRNNLEEDERIIFINAWNEWAEGAYLEPDFHKGYAYLDATALALIDSDKNNDTFKYFEPRLKFEHFEFNKFKYNYFNKISEDNYIIDNLSKEIERSILVFSHNIGGGADVYLSKKIETEMNNNNKLSYIIISQFDNYMLEIYIKHDIYIYYFDNLKDIKFLFSKFNIVEIFINSLVLFSNFYDVIDYIIEMHKLYNVKIVYPMHDYFCICPNCNLLYKQKYFCEIPNNENIHICKECISNTKYNIKEYREKFQQLFDNVYKILVFSNSSKGYINKIFKINKDIIDYVPHKVDWIRKIEKKSLKKGNLHVGIVGNITEIKGYSILIELLEKSLYNNYNIVFYCIGKLYKDVSYKNLFVTGVYKDNLVEIVERYDIDIFIMPSICPETFSYVTEEIILMDKPIISFNLGAQGEKISKYDKGYMAKEISADSILEILLDFYEKY